MGALAEEFETNGPFSDATPISQALSYISSMREQLGALKAEEESLRKGLGIFKIEQPSSHHLLTMEKVYTQSITEGQYTVVLGAYISIIGYT